MTQRTIGDMYNLDISFVCISKMLTATLDHIRASLPQYKDDSLKIGFYACQRTRKLVVFIEPMTITKKYPTLKTR